MKSPAGRLVVRFATFALWLGAIGMTTPALAQPPTSAGSTAGRPAPATRADDRDSVRAPRIGTLTAPQIQIGDIGCAGSGGGIRFGDAAANCADYSFRGDGIDTYINRPSGGHTRFREANATQMFQR